MEGRVQTYVSEHIQRPGDDRTIADRMARFGIYDGPEATSWTVGARMERIIPDLYILCLTKESRLGVFGAEYDTVLRIPDFQRLGFAIWKAAKANLHAGKAAEVKYHNRVVDLTKEEPPSPSAFLKRAHYASQKELRLAYPPRRGFMTPFLDVQIARPDRLIKLVK